VEPHRNNFRQAEKDLPRQAAIIRTIRQTVEQQCPNLVFTDAQGNHIEEDTLGLAIAKVLWQSDDEPEQPPQQQYQQQSINPPQRNGKEGSTVLEDSVDTTFVQDDVQVYQFLANMKRNHYHTDSAEPASASTTTTAATTSHTIPIVPPKPYQHLSPTDPSSGLHGINLAAKQHLVPAKRKTPVKIKKPSHRQDINGALVDGGHGKSGLENKHPSVSAKASILPSRVLTNFPSKAELHKLASSILPKTKHVTSSSEIPRGVTIRPSGRWQSQVYYKGASRYIGVFSDSREAAVAWIVAKELLSSVKVPQATKEEYNQWFNIVRVVVADLVQGVIVSSSTNNDSLDGM
jgi:hypothetical protein